MAWRSQTQFSGMMSLRRSFAIPQGYAAESLNGDLSSDSEAAPIKGYTLYGHQSNNTDKIARKYTYTRDDGSLVELQVRDDGTNYILEYLNAEDVRNSTKGEWLILESGLSRSITQFDGTVVKSDFGFAPFNNVANNRLVYGNGVETTRIWNGATGKIASTTINTIVLSGTQTLAQRGFTATGSVKTASGTAYVYTGISNQTFTGLVVDPTSEVTGSGVAQAVDTATLSSIDKGAIFLTAMNRLFYAGVSGYRTRVNYSDQGDITNYAGALAADGGFEDFADMGGPITGLAYLGESIIVFSAKKIVAFTFTFPTSTTKVVKHQEIADEGCVNAKAVKKFGDKIIYITPKGGIKSLTNIIVQDVFNVQDITEPIRPSIQNFVWDDATLEYSRKHRVMIAAGKSDSTQTDNNAGVMMFLTIREDGTQGWNLGVHDWFIGDMCDYNGDIHFGLSIASENFLAFDGYTKNGAPLNWRRTERVEFFEDRKIQGAWEKKAMSFIGFRGEMGPGTKLLMNLKYGTNGYITSVPMQLKYDDLNNDGNAFVKQPSLNTLGGFALGTEPLGGTVESIGELSPFMVIYPLPETYVTDYQLTMETSGSGQRVVVNTIGYYVDESEEDSQTPDLQHDVGQTF